MIRPFLDKVGKGHLITMEDTTIIMHKTEIRK